MNDDYELVFLRVGISQLTGSEPIFALRSEIEAIDRLSNAPEDTIPIDVNWNSVKSRLDLSSYETEENKKWWKERNEKSGG